MADLSPSPSSAADRQDLHEKIKNEQEPPDQQEYAPQYQVNQAQPPNQGYPQQNQVGQGQSLQQEHAQQHSVNHGSSSEQGSSQDLVNQQIEAMTTASMGVEPTTTTITRQGQVKPPDFLVLSVVVLICCCLPLGIGALINSLEVGSRHRAGDMDGALEASESAKKWANAGLAVGAAMWAVSLTAIVLIIISVASTAAADGGYYG